MKKTLCLLGLTVSLTIWNPAHCQTISTLAGNGTAGYSGDGGDATLGKLNTPGGVAVDAAGNKYIADYNNNRIRKVSPTGTITTIAGTGFGSYLAAHDGGPATDAWIFAPRGIALDAAGNIYFSDYGNNIIRKISTSGIITTIAGIPGSIPSYGGDGGPAIAAHLGQVWGLTVDAAGNIFLADQLNHRIRKINTSGIITTVAGTGFAVYTGDGVPATSTNLNEPTGVAVDAAGNIYIADNSNNRIRKVNTSGIISTIAGTGLPYGYTGDGGPATAAHMYYPRAIAVDAANNIYICDWNNSAVRKINTMGNISTVAGTGTAGFSGDGGVATAARLDHPSGVAIHPTNGDIFICDDLNNRVRRVKVGNDPRFTHGALDTQLVCPSEFYVLDTLLEIDDIDIGQTESWSALQLPAHGTLVATYSGTSTGSTIMPNALAYIPVTGYRGRDTFSVQVSDGTYMDTIVLCYNILPFPVAGPISGPDSVCPGMTVTLTDTSTTGVWSSGTTTVATVSSGGIVTGVAAGSSIISFTVNNFCGSATATKPIWVPSTVPCVPEAVAASPEAGTIRLMNNDGSGKVVVLLPNMSKNARAQVWDMSGKKVAEARTNKGGQMPIELPDASGMYIIQVNTERQNAVFRIAKTQ